jgi:hypothetical protein
VGRFFRPLRNRQGFALAQVLLFSMLILSLLAYLPSVLKRNVAQGKHTEVKNALQIFRKNFEQLVMRNDEAWLNTVNASRKGAVPSEFKDKIADLKCIGETVPTDCSSDFGGGPKAPWLKTGEGLDFYHAYLYRQNQSRRVSSTGITRSGEECPVTGQGSEGGFFYPVSSNAGSGNAQGVSAQSGNPACPIRAEVSMQPYKNGSGQCIDLKNIVIQHCTCPYWLIDVKFTINSGDPSDSLVRASNYDFQLVRSSDGAPACPRDPGGSGGGTTGTKPPAPPSKPADPPVNPDKAADTTVNPDKAADTAVNPDKAADTAVTPDKAADTTVTPDKTGTTVSPPAADTTVTPDKTGTAVAPPAADTPVTTDKTGSTVTQPSASKTGDEATFTPIPSPSSGPKGPQSDPNFDLLF